MNRLTKDHPIVITCSLVALFFFTVPAIIIVGRLLRRIWPEPVSWEILLGFLLFLLTMILGMLFGAFVFLLIAKRYVKKDILKIFYIYPGVPLISRLCALMFNWAYRDDQ